MSILTPEPEARRKVHVALGMAPECISPPDESTLSLFDLAEESASISLRGLGGCMSQADVDALSKETRDALGEMVRRAADAAQGGLI